MKDSWDKEEGLREFARRLNEYIGEEYPELQTNFPDTGLRVEVELDLATDGRGDLNPNPHLVLDGSAMGYDPEDLVYFIHEDITEVRDDVVKEMIDEGAKGLMDALEAELNRVRGMSPNDVWNTLVRDSSPVEWNEINVRFRKEVAESVQEFVKERPDLIDRYLQSTIEEKLIAYLREAGVIRQVGGSWAWMDL